MQSVPKYFHAVERKFILDLFTTFGVKVTKNMLQFGGGSSEKYYKFHDEGGVHKFKVSINDEPDYVHITVAGNKVECITVNIDKTETDAILHNMTYHKNCAVDGLFSPGGGAILLRFIINFLIQHKEKFNINRVLLTDNSYLTCKSCLSTSNIKLARFRMATKGLTWYMKYGFKPYDAIKRKPADYIIKRYRDDYEVLSKLKVGNVNMINLCKRIIKDEKLDHISIDELLKLLKKYEMVKDFIKVLALDLPKYCCLLENILLELYDPPSSKKPLLSDPFGKPMYLDI